MTSRSYHIELLTPCFCAGADQAAAEIRAPSIRGQLRWWFRALGGSASDERSLFGTAAGNGTSTSSRVRIAVNNVKIVPLKAMPDYSVNDAESYVWHYASVSGTTGKGTKGPRWQNKGVLGPGTTFKLQVMWVRDALGLRPQFEQTLNAFLALGTLGLRGTRGLGAFCATPSMNLDEIISVLTERGFKIKRRSNPDEFTDYRAALRDWASWLRYRLRKETKAERPSPLGSSSPRQTSAVHFRPIRKDNGKFGWLALEAPGALVLGKSSKSQSPLLERYDFTGPAPRPEPGGRRW